MNRNSDKIDADIIKRQFPLFSTELCKEISEAGIWYSLNEDDVMMSEDSYIRYVPLVLEGVIRINRVDIDNREILLYYLPAGEICSTAVTCGIGETRAIIKGVAETEAEILRIPIKYQERWMSEYSEWRVFIMNSYRLRFDELLETINSIAFNKMDDRLIRFFKDRYKATGSTTFVGTHQEIANALASSREVISRLLKTLERDRRVTLSRNRIDFATLIE